MTIIKGTHSRPSSVKAQDGSGTPHGAMEAIDQPNFSFKYLTIKPANQNFNALLPQATPAEITATIEALNGLANEIINSAVPVVRNSKIPVIYTYWGQFIDHDITAGTDRESNLAFNLLSGDILDAAFEPQPPSEVEEKIVNLRLPQLDLDSVYGAKEGPHDPDAFAEGIYENDKVHLALGKNDIGDPGSAFDLTRIPNPELDPKDAAGNPAPRRDLPRHGPGDQLRVPKIGDARNDENTIVAQFHTAFLHFHNAVVAWLDKNPSILQDGIFDAHDKFSVARRLVVWTYQWLVVNDYLEHVAMPHHVRAIVDAEESFFALDQEFMPLEFSVAGYRFGHSMIRDGYDFNMNFGDHTGLSNPTEDDPDVASLSLLFTFTGNGRMFERPTLPVNWIIQWDRFTEINAAFPIRSAQKIDTNLATSLGQLPFADEILKHLARRNLLRGYLLNIPTGQHVADFVKARPLTKEELKDANKPNLSTLLEEAGFDVKTPLWYYILREAEVQTQGESLGEVGTKLVAGTLVGLVKADRDSYLNKEWTPSHPTALKLEDGQEIRSISQFLQFAGVAPKRTVAAPVPA